MPTDTTSLPCCHKGCTTPATVAIIGDSCRLDDYRYACPVHVGEHKGDTDTVHTITFEA